MNYPRIPNQDGHDRDFQDYDADPVDRDERSKREEKLRNHAWLIELERRIAARQCGPKVADEKWGPYTRKGDWYVLTKKDQK